VMESGKITSIACMNAFHPAEVERVAAAAVEAGLANSLEDCSGLLYLTGAANEEGVEAALAKKMKVVCVGHRLCEVWGIAYLADRVRERWPDVEVQVVDEEEVKPPPKEKKEVKPKSNKKVGKPPKQKQRRQKDTSEAETPVAKKKRTSSEDNEEDGGVMI
jgi:outer membrane biosynthesis protein TonB